MNIIYKDHYQLLGINRLSTRSQIKNAFRRLSMVHHPDKNKNSEKSNRIYKLILNAYKILSDNETKKEYDDFLRKSRFIKNTGKTGNLKLENRSFFNNKDILQQINLTLWELDDFISKTHVNNFRRYILIILTFLDKWILEPGGFPDYFMEARKLERIDPREYIKILDADIPFKNYMPYLSVNDYYVDIRKRTDKFITKYENRTEWKEPGDSEVNLLDGIIEYNNMAIHYLSYMLNIKPGKEGRIPPFEFSGEVYNFDYK